MTVAVCHRCRKMISISMIPGGNPVALEDPEHWAMEYRACEKCGRAYCAACAKAPVLCPDCPGPRKPPPLEAQIRRLEEMADEGDQYVRSEVLKEAWGFTMEKRMTKSKVQMLRRHLSAGAFQFFAETAREDLEADDRTMNWKLRRLRDHLTARELRVFSESVERDLEEGKYPYMWWNGSYCWSAKFLVDVSYKFVELLAKGSERASESGA